ncbi:MAG: ABC transporter ATP-binding protein [Puniceicoccales bacterium]|jgi:ABC-type nitrate/sulfonate/bicarbonate transport system ATPase subunit|nr:ABC transporter ATP-binding protein [Puniceicoccales bacterium]
MSTQSFSTAATVSIRNLSKTFAATGDAKKNKRSANGDGGIVRALANINLEIAPGSFTVLVGASGCGKTTLLRIIAGLETADADGGFALLDGAPVRGPGPDKGLVFQDHRLLPWLTVAANVGFGLENLPAAEREARVAHYIALVGLNEFADAWPAQLSGGMAQRAAIARAIASRPRILLLDEPLGALDAITRLRLQAELERIWREEQITVVMVTHDVEEALYLGDTVVVLSPRPGHIKHIQPVAIARPRERESAVFQELRRQLLEELELRSHPAGGDTAAYEI